MEILLDTHYLIWYLTDDSRITEEVKELISNPENNIYYSTVSLWEIEIKHKKHPDIVPFTSKIIADACLDCDIENLPIFNKHVYQLNKIKKKDNTPPHNDPFDLMLLAQSKRAGFVFLTHDHLLANYDYDFIYVV